MVKKDFGQFGIKLEKVWDDGAIIWANGDLVDEAGERITSFRLFDGMADIGSQLYQQSAHTTFFLQQGEVTIDRWYTDARLKVIVPQSLWGPALAELTGLSEDEVAKATQTFTEGVLIPHPTIGMNIPTVMVNRELPFIDKWRFTIPGKIEEVLEWIRVEAPQELKREREAMKVS